MTNSMMYVVIVYMSGVKYLVIIDHYNNIHLLSI